jgi:hypothetical protein
MIAKIPTAELRLTRKLALPESKEPSQWTAASLPQCQTRSESANNMSCLMIMSLAKTVHIRQTTRGLKAFLVSSQ